MGTGIICKLCTPSRIISYVATGSSQEKIMAECGPALVLHISKEHEDNREFKALMVITGAIIGKFLDVKTQSEEDIQIPNDAPPPYPDLGD